MQDLAPAEGDSLTFSVKSPIVLPPRGATGALLNTSRSFHWEASANNSQTVPTGNEEAFTFSPEDDGEYTVTVTITDRIGTGNITNATNTTPITIKSNDHLLVEGEQVTITGVEGIFDPGNDLLQVENDPTGAGSIVTLIDDTTVAQSNGTKTFPEQYIVGAILNIDGTDHKVLQRRDDTSLIIADTSGTRAMTTTAGAHVAAGKWSLTLPTAANGTWTVTVIDENEFTLDNSAGNFAYLHGGRWTKYTITTSTNLAFTASDVAPTIDVSGANTIPENGRYVLELGEAYDPGNDQVDKYTIDWGDDSSESYRLTETAGNRTWIKTKDITRATHGTPITITSESHGLETGDEIQIAGVEGNTNANANATTLDNQTWTVIKINDDELALIGDTAVLEAPDVSGTSNWWSFDPDTGVLSGTPTNTDVGKVHDVVITATDGNGGDFTQQFVIDVLAFNNTLTLDSAASNSTTATEDSLFVHYISTSDPGGSLAEVTALEIPTWLELKGQAVLTELVVDQPGLVVNHYTALTNNALADSTTITVADAGGFSTGDQVMVIQMQHNTQAGNYELKMVESVTGNTITVIAGLTHNYHQDTATTNASRAQVVKVPRYNTVTITPGSSLSAQPWNGSTGGILVLDASGNVTIESGATIDVSGLGFRGALQNSRTDSWHDGYRGEGHTGGHNSQAALTNTSGGGGGIAGCPGDGNAGGGGGGGNLGAGENGNSYYSCTQGSAAPGKGQGGSAIASANSGKLLLGGGGGSGGLHNTSGFTGPAGNGGGIIHIRAASITVDGSIEANGTAATPFSGAPGNYKGGSGGGAGGTIDLITDASISSTNIQVQGGHGSNGYIRSSGSYKNSTPEWQKGGSGGVGQVKLTQSLLLSNLGLNSGANLSNGTLTLTDNQYADIPSTHMGDWGSESFEVSVTIKSADGTGNVSSEGTGAAVLFIRSSQAGSPYTGPTAFLWNDGQIQFRLRGDDRLIVPDAVSSWADWVDLRFVYEAAANSLQVLVNGEEKGRRTLTRTADSSYFKDAPLRFGANHVNESVQNLNAQIRNLQISGLEPPSSTPAISENFAYRLEGTPENGDVGSHTIVLKATNSITGTVADDATPHSDTVGEIQQITLTSATQNDTFDITYDNGQGNPQSVTVTVGADDNATATAIEDALNTIDSLTVSVSADVTLTISKLVDVNQYINLQGALNAEQTLDSSFNLETPIQWNLPTTTIEGVPQRYVLKSDWWGKRPKDMKLLHNDVVIGEWTHPSWPHGCYESSAAYISDAASVACHTGSGYSYSSVDIPSYLNIVDTADLMVRVTSTWSASQGGRIWTGGQWLVDGGHIEAGLFDVEFTEPAATNVASLQIATSTTTDAVIHSFTVTVANTNDPPHFTSTPITNATVGDVYSYSVVGADTDPFDFVTLSTSPSIPSWLSFDPKTGVLSSETVTNDLVGPHDVVITATDKDGKTDTQSFTITVGNTNTDVSFTSNPVTSAVEDTVYSHQATAVVTGSEDNVILQATIKPDWLTFDASSGLLTGEPSNDDVGPHSVTLTATETDATTVHQSFTITVTNTNDRPTITSQPVTVATAGRPYSYTVTADDPDKLTTGNAAYTRGGYWAMPDEAPDNNLTHRYADDGTYLISVDLTSEDMDFIAAGTLTTPEQQILQFTNVSGGSFQLQIESDSEKITDAANADPIQVTSAAHGLATGNQVTVIGVEGNTNANGTWTVTVVDENKFTLNNASGNGKYTGGGRWQQQLQTEPISFSPDPVTLRQNIQSALNLLPGYQTNVTGDGIAPWTIEFIESPEPNAPLLTVGTDNLIGSDPNIKVATHVDGSEGVIVTNVRPSIPLSGGNTVTEGSEIHSLTWGNL